MYDRVIRQAACDHSYRIDGLRAVCGHMVLPASRLTDAQPCRDCAAGLIDADEPRPAPGNPPLREMARITSELIR